MRLSISSRELSLSISSLLTSLVAACRESPDCEPLLLETRRLASRPRGRRGGGRREKGRQRREGTATVVRPRGVVLACHRSDSEIRNERERREEEKIEVRILQTPSWELSPAPWKLLNKFIFFLWVPLSLRSARSTAGSCVVYLGEPASARARAGTRASTIL